MCIRDRLLTTHDMRDIEEICERVLMIDNGKLTFDLPLTKLKETLGSRQTLIIHFEEKEMCIRDRAERSERCRRQPGSQF